MRKLIYFSALGLFIVNLTGCAMFSKQENLKVPPASLQSQVVLKFADLPVPLGFRLLTQESYSFENAGTRVAVLRYQGKASTAQVVNFYKEQMPMFNWKLLNIIEYGNCMLNLEKENETCVINIAPKGNNSVISISLGPKSQALPKRSKQVIK
jgi:hypothetical protein